MKGAIVAARFLKAHKQRLVTAESCTAGKIAAAIADLKGAGDLLECAFVTYSPQAKKVCLGVPAATLRNFNLTSEEVALAMLLGALRHSAATCGIANTGVADATDPEVPAGTQCFAWGFRGRRGGRPRVVTETVRFTGSRNAVREAAAAYALQRLPVHGARLLGASRPT